MKLFISYAYADRSLVLPLVDLLRGAGHTVLFDDPLNVDQNWQDQLRQQIDSVDSFVYAMTPLAMANEWCQWEMVTAVEHNKPIILVMLQRTYLPSYLINRRRADFINGFSDAGRTADFLGSLNHFPLIPRTETLPKPAFPEGLPTRVPQDTQASHARSSPKVALGGNTSVTARPSRAPIILVIALLVLIAAAIIFVVPNWDRISARIGLAPTNTPTPTATLTPSPVPSATPTPLPTSTPEAELIAATADETLIVLAPFEGGAAAEANGLVMQSLSEVVEAAAARDINVRIGFVGDEVTTSEAARRIANRYNAAMVVWGEVYAEGVTSNVEFRQRSGQPNASQNAESRFSVAPVDRLTFHLTDPDQPYLTDVLFGHILFANGRYEHAASIFGKAVGYAARQPVPRQIDLELGTVYAYEAYSLHGDEEGGQPRQQLEAAVEAYQEALARTETASFTHAVLEDNLGMIYTLLARLGASPRANLESAVAAHTGALEIISDDTDPVNYARAQNNLGIAYSNLAALGVDAQANLDRAVTAYEEALRFRTIEAAPLDFARTQGNLGVTYTRLADIGIDSQRNLERAINAYQRGSEQLAASESVVEYALMQGNLGAAYTELAILNVDAEANLERALAVYQDTLQVLSPQTNPLEYARMQTNLGSAYGSLAQIEVESDANFERAIAAYEEALRFYTESDYPLEYATTRVNMGVVYASHGEFAESCAAWRESESIVREFGNPAYADQIQRYIDTYCADFE